MAGKIVADQLEHSTAGTVDTQFVVNGSAKAWVGALDSNGSAIDSFAFSSFVDNGTGDNTCNFANAMANLGYSAVTSAEDSSSPSNRLAVPYAKATNLFKIESFIADTAGNSGTSQNSTVHGDLA